MSETALYSCQAGVFKNENGAWVQIDGGLSKIWIMHNVDLNVYRVVASSTTTNQFVLNSTLTSSVNFQRASEVFLQWTDSVRVNGINFPPGVLPQFESVAVGAVNTLKGGNPSPPPPRDNAPPPPRDNAPPPPRDDAPPPPRDNAPPPPRDNAPPPRDNAPPPPRGDAPPPPRDSGPPPPTPSNNAPMPRTTTAPPPPPPGDRVAPPIVTVAPPRDNGPPPPRDNGPPPPSDNGPPPPSDNGPPPPRDNGPPPPRGDNTSNTIRVASLTKSASVRQRSLDASRKDSNVEQKVVSGRSLSKKKTKKGGVLTAVSIDSLPSVGNINGSGREYAAKQMYAEQIEYLNALKSLLNDWIGDMKNKKITGAEDTKTMMGIFEPIYIAESNLAQSLSQEVVNWNNQSSIAEIIFDNFETLMPYYEYAESYASLLNLYDKFKKKQKIWDYVEVAREERGVSIVDLFELPYRRTIRMEKLIRTMKLDTQPNHPDFENTIDLYNSILKFRDEIWGNARKAEQTREFADLIERNFTGLEEIMEPQREYILDGPRRASLNQVDCTWVILFNDCIAFCAPVSGEKGNKPKRYIQQVLKYDVCWITPTPDIGKGAFEIKTPEITVLVREREDLYVSEMKKTSKKKGSGPFESKIKTELDWTSELQTLIFEWLTREDNEDADLNRQYNSENPDKRVSSYDYVDGSSYTGTWIKAKYEGDGIFFSGNGAQFIGNFERGALEGQGAVIYSNGDMYEGGWLRDLPSGTGKLTYASGRVYEGDWDFGKKIGQGVLTWENGDKYKGSFEFDRMFGSGVLYLKDQGLTFTGTFLDDQIHGTGKLEGNGYFYEGDWKFGQKHGKGKEVTALGTYIGEFEYDRKTGEGEFTSADGNITYQGYYLNDKFSNKGTLKNKTLQYRYKGYWKNGLKHGKGQEQYVSGRSYKGSYRHDYYQGPGTLSLEDGTTLVGNFELGTLEGEGNITYSNGSVYEGFVVTNMRHGLGKIVYPNGSSYNGNWLDDEKSGYGRNEYADGTIYDGAFEKNRRNGHGVETTSVYTFSGNWENNIKHGNGTMIFTNGDKYEGEWSKGRKVGKGIFIEGHSGKQTAQVYNKEGIMTTPGIKYFPPDLPQQLQQMSIN